MSRSGLWAQVGMAAEGTVGTYQTPTRFLEMVSESMDLQVGRVESQALRAGSRTLRSDRWMSGSRVVGGELQFEVADRGFGLPLAYAFGGGTATITTPAGGTNTRDHTIVQALNYGRALTVQVGRPDTAGTVNPFSYLGCKVTEASLSSEVDGLLQLSMTLAAHDESQAQSLAAVSYPATQALLAWVGGTLSLAGAALDVTNFTFNVNHGLKTDRFLQRGSGGTIIKEPIEAAMAEVTGKFTVEFESVTQYNRFVNGTIATLAGTWQAATIEGSLQYQLAVGMAAVRFDGETPKVGGPDVLTMQVPYKALVSGTLSPYTLVYRTTDTTL
ncbi:MAG: phage tail tube protein [Thermoleophilia bacterium]